MLVFQHQPKASEGELIQPNNGYSIAAHRLMNKLILFIRHPLHMQRPLVKILHWTVSLGDSANDLPFYFQFEIQTGPLPPIWISRPRTSWIVYHSEFISIKMNIDVQRMLLGLEKPLEILQWSPANYRSFAYSNRFQTNVTTICIG